ncbi:c-type cytochrome biogenesis protein CcsB [Gordonia jinhuaensis]|uniref:C-type cytochrome biogenesis protein CcsB n=1 Tax=Gordonia jinhuaensis TaxID=1517702 RepID=A0A916SY28_9ACTN|nr:c-type cytochrome biogenesis protein CcsB [Gordonia jinhuaensis]GGB21635.1 c-type cytochrome biogenesis protein CcsB [Gordonia jinhuaensis]
MDVNENLSRFSDLSFGTALTIYVIAMVLLLWSLASARTRTSVVTQKAELVGAGASSGGSTSITSAPPADTRVPGRVVDTTVRVSRGEKLAKMGYAVLIVGAIAHVASIVLRGFATHRAPWGNMYEFISITCAAGVIAGLIVLRRPEQRPLLSFVLVPVALLMFFGGEYLYTQAAPVVPALKSYWLAIHVSIVSIGSGVFLVSGVASALYLIKRKYPDASDSDSVWGRILSRVPSAEALDRLAYRTVVFAFPLFGLGVICGAIWAESAWGRFWGWDPKETVSFIAWIIYAAYLHARATAGWRQAAAWINIAGFVAMLFNLFIINLVVSGLHSYAGL